MGVSGFDIGQRHVGDGAPCLIVAEVAQAHEGSLAMAHAYVDAAADAGADAIKFQIHDAEHESTPDEPWRVAPKWRQDESRFDYWKRMEFTPAHWRSLAVHARAKGLAFIVSPFSVEAVQMLGPTMVDAWKVASGEITNVGLLVCLDACLPKRPVLISTGMARTVEATIAVATFSHVPVALLQCTSEYPCRPEHVGLSVLSDWRDCPFPTGLSDHSGTIYAGLAAVALGCDVLEVHIKLSKHDQGFDASSSITIEELRQLVEGVRFIEKAKQPVDKDLLAKELEPMRRLFLDKHKRKAASTYCLSCDRDIFAGDGCWHTPRSGPSLYPEPSR